MSLEKLLDLLLEQSLYFSQVKELQSQDPFEGHHSRGSIHLNLQFLNDPELLRSVVEQNWRGSKIPDLNNPEILGRIMGIFHPSTLELLANFSASQSYVNCWHINDHESAALWKLYCPGESGYSIRSSIGRLKESLSSCPKEIFVGQVDYIDYDTKPTSAGNFLDPIFKKRISFAHERELRLCFTEIPQLRDGDDLNNAMSIIHRNPPGITVNCNTEVLINEIVVSPTSPPWCFNSVKKMVGRLFPSIIVRRSTLLTSPKYTF